MFVCEKNSSCIGCNYQYADRLDQIDEEFRDCSRLIEVKEVKHASWIKDERQQRDDGEIYDYCCSLCRGAAPEGEYGNHDVFTDFCPHCGATMDLQEYL